MKCLVFDTETGGIGAEAAQNWSIIQLGAVAWDDGVLCDEGSSFDIVIDESKEVGHAHYQQEALEVNGFTLDRIQAEGVTPSIATLRFVLWLQKHFPIAGGKVTLVGHNVGYDVSFLQRLFRLAGVLGVYDEIFNYRTVDTASIARYLIECGNVPPQAKDSKGLFEHFNCAPTKVHDALYDAIATGHLYTKLLALGRHTVPSIHPGDVPWWNPDISHTPIYPYRVGFMRRREEPEDRFYSELRKRY